MSTTSCSIKARNSQSLSKRKSDILAIFAYLKQHGPKTRDGVSQGLNLCSGSTCARVRDCLRGNLIYEKGTGVTSTGRKAALLNANHNQAIWDLEAALSNNVPSNKKVTEEMIRSILGEAKSLKDLANLINKELKL